MPETITTAELVEYAEQNGLTVDEENSSHIRYKNLDDNGEPQWLPKTVRECLEDVEGAIALRYILHVEK